MRDVFTIEGTDYTAEELFEAVVNGNVRATARKIAAYQDPAELTEAVCDYFYAADLTDHCERFPLVVREEMAARNAS